MPGEDYQSWSVTAVNNGNSDTSIEWREGQTRASVNNSSRSEMAAHAKNRNLLNGSIVTGGSANTQTFTSGVSYIAPIPTGLIVRLKIGAGLTNTGPATLNMDGIGDTGIKLDTGDNLGGGELVGGCYTDFVFDGSNWIFLYSREFFQELINGGGGVIIGTQIFSTPGSFTYTPTTGTEACIIECIAGGGGGGGVVGASDLGLVAGGGGSGGYSRTYANAAAIGSSQAVTVGAGGAGGAGAAFGGGGGPTTFGSLCTANAGAGGQYANNGTTSGSPGGAGGASGTGNIAAAGNAGGGGMWTSGANVYAADVTSIGNGAASAFGGAAVGNGGSSHGTAGRAYGAGGSGGASYVGNFASANGGAGSSGIVIVTEFAGRGAPGRNGLDGAPGPIGPTGPSGPGTGDVLRAGTPAAGQIAQWTDASHIQGIDFSGFTTGDVKLTFKTTADATWVLMNDGSIGNVASGATTRANADTSPLFVLLYNNIAALVVQNNTGATVARGASAAADYAANRRLVLPAVLGRALAGAGAGSGLTSRTLGATVGEESHTQTIAEMAPHGHGINAQSAPATGTPFVSGAAGADFTAPTQSTGGGAPMNVMQPTSFLNVMIKL